MRTAQIKILSGAVALREFTPAELQRATEVNIKTIRNTLGGSRGAGAFIVDTGRTRELLPGRSGAPQKIFAFDAAQIESARTLLDTALENAELASIPRPDDAERAFNDRSGLLQIERHLLLAGPSADAEQFEFHLKRAERVLDAENLRIDDFRAHYTPPEALTGAIDDYHSWIAAYKMGVADLAAPEFAWDIEMLANWFTRGIEAWFSCRTEQCATAFSPLAFGVPAGVDRVKALVPQLIVVLENIERTARVPQFTMVYAMMMALARLETTEMRRGICETMKAFGLDQVGEVLQLQNPMALDETQSRDVMLQFLEACNTFPDLLGVPAIADWLSSLSVREGWSYELAAAYIEQLDRISGTERGQSISLRNAIRNNRSDLEQLFAAAGEAEDTALTFGTKARQIWQRFVGTKRLESVRHLVNRFEQPVEPGFEARHLLQDNFINAGA